MFGGDGRGYLVERVDEHCVVTAYEGDASNAERVAQATRQGSFTHVVALKRWMNHSQWHKLHDVCKQTGTTFVTWTRGLGSLKKEIEQWAHADRALLFETKKEEKIMETTSSSGVIIDTAARVKPDFRGVTAHVREAFAIDPRKEWTVRALSEFLYSVEDNLTMQVIAAKLRIMEKSGEIRAVGGIAKSATNPRRFVLATAPEITAQLGKTSNGQVMEIAPTVPQGEDPAMWGKKAQAMNSLSAPTPETPYAVILSLSGELISGEGFKVFSSKAEAIECVRANPGARLFREVKLRVTVEIDE